MRVQRGLYYGGEPTQRVYPKQVQHLKQNTTGSIKAQPPAVQVQRVYPERFLATVHTPALVIDGEWSQGDANMATAIIDDTFEELLFEVMERYDIKHARVLHVAHTPITVNYLKQGWLWAKKFPVTHFLITMLIEEVPG